VWNRSWKATLVAGWHSVCVVHRALAARTVLRIRRSEMVLLSVRVDEQGFRRWADWRQRHQAALLLIGVAQT